MSAPVWRDPPMRVVSPLAEPDRAAPPAVIADVPWTTAADLCAGAEPEEAWVAWPIASPGCTTLVVGAPKRGKTTAVHRAISAIVRGADWLGRPTMLGPVVVLTEEGRRSYRRALRRAGLSESRDVHVLSRRAVPVMPWPDLVVECIAHCRRVGAVLLVVDTLAACAGLVGDEEQSAGVAAAVMAPILASIGDDLAIILVAHARKAGGSAVSAMRGSSAFAGAVEIVALLDEGAADGLRRLEVVGRLDAPDWLEIELASDGYRVVASSDDDAPPGDPTGPTVDLVSMLPASPPGMSAKEVAVSASKPNSPVSRTTAKRLLDEAYGAGRVGRKGAGKKGKPHRYWRLLRDVEVSS